MSVLSTGANGKVSSGGLIEATLSWSNAPSQVDLTAFGVKDDGKVVDEVYMIFYGQETDPEGAIQFVSDSPNQSKIVVDTAKLNSSITKIVISATLDGVPNFGSVSGKSLKVSGDSEVTYEFNHVDQETAVDIGEVYFRNGEWKFRAVGAGYTGGLKPLAESRGITIADEAEEAPVAAPISLTKKEAKAISLKKELTEEPKNAISLKKREVIITLEKKKILGETAKVVAVVDASGSMSSLFSRGTVQRAFERSLAVAMAMDDDQEMEVYFFADKPLRTKSVTERDFEGYVKREFGSPGSKWIGYGNNEPKVMRKLMDEFGSKKSDVPVYVLFFSDGGIYKDNEIKKLMIEASAMNIFWQFIGIGDADFGILEDLDDMRGRVIDNADFFSLRDLDKVTDAELYDRMLNEFPGWLKEARRVGIITE